MPRIVLGGRGAGGVAGCGFTTRACWVMGGRSLGSRGEPGWPVTAFGCTIT